MASAAYGTGALALAQKDSKLTGLSSNVILTQWYAENPSIAMHASQWGNMTNPNNPGNIRVGNAAADALANATSIGGFDIFPTPAIGAQAYADVMNQSNFSQVRQAKGDSNQLQALATSNWDAGHYQGNTGKVGGALVKDYPIVTGKKLSGSSSYRSILGGNLHTTLANWDNTFSAPSFTLQNMFTGNLFAGDILSGVLRALFVIIGMLVIILVIAGFIFKSPTVKNAVNAASSLAPLLA